MEGLQKIEIRKIVPTISRVSSGKSRLLNVLYNIKFLECRKDITTKFINLLRYNPNISNPCFYHLKIKKQGEDYIFYKDLSEIYIGEKDIIEANKKINKKLSDTEEINYEDIFYMIEINDSPFIKDKEYLLSHDLCDIPGLSEYQGIQIKEEENSDTLQDIKNCTNQKSKNKVKKENEDEIYYKVGNIEEKTYLAEIFKIIKNYIDGGILIFNVENYFYDENFELIAKLYKIIQTNIENYLIILNKIDLSENPEKDIEELKGKIINNFPKFETFNLNLNTFIPLSVIQVENELLMEKSFKHLIYYHFYNYYSKVRSDGNMSEKSFMDHLKSIIKLDKEMTQNIKSELNSLNESKNISEIKTEIKSVIEEIRKEFKGKNINFGFPEENDDEDDDSDEEKNPDLEGNNDINDDIDEIDFFDVFKLIYIDQMKNGKNLALNICNETKVLLNYFSNNKTKFHKYENDKDEEENSEEKPENIKKIQNYLNELINKFEKSKINIDKINSLINEIKKTSYFLKYYNSIYIPFIGASNTGKSTIINSIIGQEILPTDLNACTKRGIIIRYGNEGDDRIILRKVNLVEEKYRDESFYHFEIKNTIAKGITQVTQTLKGLNYKFADKDEDSFYYISTKIKLFDDLGLDYSLKRMIYLIDFPGYGVNNKFIEKKICSKVLNMSKFFIFTLRNSIIKENNTKLVLEQLFNQVKNQKKQFKSGFVKSCLFLLNNDNCLETTFEDKEKAKKDIIDMIYTNDTVDKNDIKLSFFNAKYYCDYCNNYNYFFNLKKTFPLEYENYLNSKINIFKCPEISKYKSCNSFFEYLQKKLSEKIINLFGIKNNKLKKTKINKNTQNEIDHLLNDFSDLGYINFNMNEIFNKKDEILRFISYSQDNIKKLKTLKDSNIEDFKIILHKQFINIINNKQIQLKENLDELLSIIDDYFKSDLLISNSKNDSKEIEDFQINIKYIKLKIVESFNSNLDELKQEILNIKCKIMNIILSKNDESNTNENNVNKLENIDNYIEDKIKKINNEINIILSNINLSSISLYEEYQKRINNFSGGKIDLKKISKFEDFLLSKMGAGNQNIKSKICDEIIANTNLSNVYKSKGFKELVKSFFSKNHLLNNKIDILKDKLFGELESLLNNLNEHSRSYMQIILDTVNISLELSTIKFTEEQSIIWEEIGKYYNIIKNDIKKSIVPE